MTELIDTVAATAGVAGCGISLYTIIQQFRDRGEDGWARAFTVLTIVVMPPAIFALIVGYFL